MTGTKGPSLRHRLYYGGPVLLYAGLIFVLSSLPGLPETVSPFVGFDKFVHFIAYYPLGWLLYRWFAAQNPIRGHRHLLVMTLLVGIAYAAGDEWHQSFVPGRDASVYDLLFDAAGIAAAGFTYPYVYRKVFANGADSPGRVAR